MLLWHSSHKALLYTLQGSVKRPDHCWYYILLIEFTRPPGMVNPDYFLLTYITTIYAGISPEPCGSRNWLPTIISVLNSACAEAIGQR